MWYVTFCLNEHIKTNCFFFFFRLNIENCCHIGGFFFFPSIYYNIRIHSDKKNVVRCILNEWMKCKVCKLSWIFAKLKCNYHVEKETHANWLMICNNSSNYDYYQYMSKSRKKNWSESQIFMPIIKWYSTWRTNSNFYISTWCGIYLRLRK